MPTTGTRAHRASVETWAMSDAVQKALEMTNEEDTLIVVSADHSHVVTMNGYSHIDSDLYGKSCAHNKKTRFRTEYPYENEFS